MFIYHKMYNDAVHEFYRGRYPVLPFLKDRNSTMLIHISHTDMDGVMCTAITNKFLTNVPHVKSHVPMFVQTKNIRASGQDVVDVDIADAVFSIIENRARVNTESVVLLITDLGQVSVNHVRSIIRERSSELEQRITSVIVIDHHQTPVQNNDLRPEDIVYIIPGHSATYLYHQILLASACSFSRNNALSDYWDFRPIMDILVNAVNDHDIGKIFTGWGRGISVEDTPLSFRLSLYFNYCVELHRSYYFEQMIEGIVQFCMRPVSSTDNNSEHTINYDQCNDYDHIMDVVIDRILMYIPGFNRNIRKKYEDLLVNYNKFITGIEQYASNYDYSLVREALGIDESENPKLNVYVDDPDHSISGFTQICSRIGASYPDVLLIGVFPQRMSVEFRCAHVEAGKSDCYRIAKRNGGGGHLNASGCPITEEQLHTICPWMKNSG